jgi:hypothetical protein
MITGNMTTSLDLWVARDQANNWPLYTYSFVLTVTIGAHAVGLHSRFSCI